MTIITLASGGIDSLVMAKLIEKENEQQIPLFIDYGQLAAEKEWEACKKVFKMSNLPNPIKIDLSGYGKLIKSGITDSSIDIHEQAFLPGRNLLFLVIASAFAHQKDAKKIAIGLLLEELHLFPDQTSRFIVNANMAVNEAMDEDLVIVTPLIKFTKNDVIKLAKHYNLLLEETYSCHSGQDKYCDKCISCRELRDASEGKDLPQFKRGDD
ncbi:MAG: 7-cyano-7-deazaguanine synthase [Candidatus Lokiarchaeota archaeon]|nr:7-cyano-7-deazaguanine synthase [Candidatus Lokiarchaeota archaeon]